MRGSRRALDGGGVHARRIDRVPRILAILRLGGVALGGNAAQIGEGALGAGIADDDHFPPLAVPAAGGEARMVQDLHQGLVGKRIAGELPRGKGGTHHLVELHGLLPVTSLRSVHRD